METTVATDSGLTTAMSRSMNHYLPSYCKRPTPSPGTERRRLSSRAAAYERVLAKVPAGEPVPGDERAPKS